MLSAKPPKNIKKASITPLNASNESEKSVDVLFNPTEYSFDKSNNFSEISIPGLDSPLVQFTKGNLKTLTMDLFFDTYTYYEGVDVRKHTNQVVDLMKVRSDTHAPPVCIFSWGQLNFKCVLQQVRQRFTMFNSDGVPVRATLTVTFKEYTTVDIEIRKTPRSSPDRTKLWTVKEGDNLWLIAAREYGDATKWRPIADRNKIENPRILEPGTEIFIPPLER